LLRAQLLQILYTIRRERLLMEEMDYNLQFRWFVRSTRETDGTLDFTEVWLGSVLG
jgi:transposase